MEDTLLPEIYIAPLQINKVHSPAKSRNLHRLSMSAVNRSGVVMTQSNGEMTPPLTPHESRQPSSTKESGRRWHFPTYLRAFSPYHPMPDETSSTVTLPLDHGDVVLIHSVHTNGWADGTLITSGARGWLPTNYCEPYESDPVRLLLKAVTGFWELVRGSAQGVQELAGSQEYIRALIRGVKYLLERTDCFSRESSLVQVHPGLRQNRKALLADLSSLVRCAKSVETLASEASATSVPERRLDEIMMKVFRLVDRSVKFFDAWEDAMTHGERFPIGSNVPPTPPAERVHFGPVKEGRMQETLEAAALAWTSSVGPTHPNGSECSSDQTPTGRCCSVSSTASWHAENQASSIASATTRNSSHARPHRASCSARPSRSLSCFILASDKLSTSHDTFLGFLGTFIGLHLQSRSSTELLLTTRQSVTSCRDLLRVVEGIWERDRKGSEALEEARHRMYRRITDLVGAARDVFRPAWAGEDGDVLLPSESKPLVDAATACVRGAGDCVAEAHSVIDRIGDFDFEPLDLPFLEEESVEGSFPGELPVDDGMSLPAESSAPLEPTRPPPPPMDASETHPIASAGSSIPVRSTWPTRDMFQTRSAATPPRSSYQLSLPKRSLPFTRAPPLQACEGMDEKESARREDPAHEPRRTRVEDLRASDTDRRNPPVGSIRNSENSGISQASTRVTSPDGLHGLTLGASSATTSFCSSEITLSDVCEEGEVNVGRTYAHEVMCNKDGQITGGTLPALIERLTISDATPDATFVSTFYLTFRMFATPTEFAQGLIDRFIYVADSPRISGPVRLRVYNVFKGWLESHWRNDCDSPALELIVPFALRQLQAVLPTAGRRLASLAEKVGATNGPLVPRLISSMGKTNTAIAQYVSPDAPIPAPIITKGQLTALKNWKHGGASISILDFDPLELARQFTIKESRIFCSILPEELLATEWTKKSGSMAVNVRAMSRLSTDLANLVADCILQSECPKKRAAVIKQWVKIANKCLDLANYDSLIAIICALNTATILRLRRTWELLSTKTKTLLGELSGVVDVSRNYAVLRQRLQNHMPPCLPFVGTYLTDLTFVDVGNSPTRQLLHARDNADAGQTVINFDKHMKTAKIISDLQRFQVPYRFVEVPELQTWIQDQLVRVRSSDQSNVQSYYRRSLILEPREPLAGRPAGPAIEGGGAPSSATSFFSNGGNSSKEKFDLFGLGWTHHSKDKGTAATTP